MYRRTALAGAGTALVAAAAGCIQEIGDANADDPSDGDADLGADVEPATAGSDADESGDGEDEDTVPVLTDVAVSDEAVQPDVERTSDMDAWGVFVASRDAAVEAFGHVDRADNEAACSFLDGTDFDAGETLVYVEAHAPQLCYDLRLGNEPRVGQNGLTQVTLDVNRTAPSEDPCGDAITPVDILLRLSFDPAEPDPDVVSVRVAGHRDQPEELMLEAVR